MTSPLAPGTPGPDQWRFRGDRALTGSGDPPLSRTIGDLVDEMAGRAPEIEAVVFGAARLTYAALQQHANAVALGLLARGINKGDHVGILLGNRTEWMVAWIAANKIGATVVGISTWSSSRELEYILRHSDTRMLIYGDALGQRNLSAVVDECLTTAGWSGAARFSPQLPCLRSTLMIRTDGDALASFDKLTRDGLAVRPGMLAALARDVRAADVALLLYTSGSTSTPKGVQLVHRVLIEHAYEIGEAELLARGDRFWLSLPLFWSAGSANSAMAVLTHGATLVLQEYFEPATAIRLLRDERCTHYFAFPNVTQAIHKALGADPRLPAARVAVTSGQPEILQMLRGMGFTLLLHPYGTTEDYGFATINGPDETLESLGWSQGRPLPGIELRICDPDTRTIIAPGAPGEICLRGNVTIGYYKDEEKNRQVFDDEGFFHTGDLGIQHADGRLQFLGRLTELIKTSGFNVSPAEVESALLAFDGVGEAYVVGVPDAERGQAVVAWVRASAGNLPLEALERHCAVHLSSYKVPRRFLMLDSFPLTATGKVSKETLRRMAAERNAAEAT